MLYKNLVTIYYYYLSGLSKKKNNSTMDNDQTISDPMEVEDLFVPSSMPNSPSIGELDIIWFLSTLFW